MLGQAVGALVPGGGYAEYCAAPAGSCLPVPQGFSMAEAAALPETLFTVWHNLFERAWVCEGEKVLVHGGTSGLGTTAIGLCKLFEIGRASCRERVCKYGVALGGRRIIKKK